jgi:hypothetical protein
METKSSAVGTIFSVIGGLNALLGLIGCFMWWSQSFGAQEKYQGMVMAVSGISGALVCFAISSALHYLAEIASRLENLQLAAVVKTTERQEPSAAVYPKK